MANLVALSCVTVLVIWRILEKLGTPVNKIRLA